ncbi:hypothetical protein ABGB08_08940 [Acrocarpospora sp. B8E8]
MFWVLVGGGVLLAVVIGLVLLMVLVKRRKRPQAPVPYGHQPQYYQAQQQPYALPSAPVSDTTQYVRPGPYQQAQVADLERELAELRRQLGQRPPGA